MLLSSSSGCRAWRGDSLLNADECFSKLAALSTAVISDAMFRMGHKDRTMRSRIKPIDPEMRVAGPAFTVQAYPGGTHACSMALEAVRPGQVLVIDGQGFLEAVLWGEIFSLMAMTRGVKGAVIDGAVRDIAEVKRLGFPLFAAGVHPAAGTGDRLGKIDVPIQCGGIVVRPGDFVFGDLLGVVVVPPDELQEVYKECQQILEKEARVKAELRARLGKT